jgi:hypothetical protein
MAPCLGQLNWLTEPDGAQHALGVGSPEAIEAIRNDDRHIGLVIEKLTALGLAEFTNIFAVSDHGFGVHTFAINVSQALIGAGLKAAPDSAGVGTRHLLAQADPCLQRRAWS